MWEPDTLSILLRSTTTSTWINVYKWLPIWTFSMLILHMCVQCWIRKISLITECAFMVTSLHVVLRTAFLLVFTVFIVIPVTFSMLTIFIRRIILSVNMRIVVSVTFIVLIVFSGSFLLLIMLFGDSLWRWLLLFIQRILFLLNKGL